MGWPGFVRTCALGGCALALVACGSASRVATTPPPKHRPAHASVSGARATDAGFAADSSTIKSVIVLPPSAGPYVLLYPEEREALRARVVRAIAALDSPKLVPWSDEKMRALADRVKAGKLRENGPVCARPPTLADVVDAETHGGANENILVASTSLDCDGSEECMIQVSVGGLEGERDADLMLSAKVAGDGGVDSWLAAADELAAVDELVGNGYGFGSGSRPPTFVSAALRHTLGDFGSTFAASPAVPPTAALAACHDASPMRRTNSSYDALITVDVAGHGERCTVLHDEPPRDSAAAKRETCICQAVQKTKFPAAPSNADPAKNAARRALYKVVDFAPPKKSVHGLVDARVNVLEGEGHPEASNVLDVPALSDCFLASNPKEDLSFDLHLRVTATGRVEGAEMATVPNQLRACLSRAFLATPFICDAEGEARVVHAGVTLALRHPPSAFDRLAPGEDPIDLAAGHVNGIK